MPPGLFDRYWRHKMESDVCRCEKCGCNVPQHQGVSSPQGDGHSEYVSGLGDTSSSATSTGTVFFTGQHSIVRTFTSGATRDSDDGKFEYSGFNSPLVEKAFAAYMHKHRVQPDGKLRSSFNWKSGIPMEAYRESMHRHHQDLELILDEFPDEAVDQDLVSVLCAIRFNVNGMLHEVLKHNRSKRHGI